MVLGAATIRGRAATEVRLQIAFLQYSISEIVSDKLVLAYL